jgi:hypothetical protein
VIVIPDNDAAGKNHALSVAAALAPIVKRVRRLDLAKHWPEMPDKADVSDWLAAGHTREELDALIAQAPDWSPHADEGAHPAQEAQQEAKPEPPPGVALARRGRHQRQPAMAGPGPHPRGRLRPDLGPMGSFKTFTALDLAHCIMTGEPFLGCEVVRRGGVLFIAVEGASEVPIRLQGVIEHKGKLVGRAPLAWTETCPPLIAADTVATLSKLAEQAAAARLKADFGLPLSLIVIDTVVAAAGYFKEGADNDTATGQVVMRTLAQLARNAGCFVFGIDHFGKDVNVGTRGTSAKEGAADVVLAMLGERTVSGEVVNTRLALRKRRGGSSGQEFPFKPRVVDMGVDRRGAPVTTLVLDWGAKDEHPKTAKDDWGHAKSLKLLRRIIMGLLADSGTDLRPWADGPTVRALNVDLVRAEFCKTWSVKGDTEKAKRDARSLAFRRALNDAVVKGFVVVREDLVWLASAAPAQHA